MQVRVCVIILTFVMSVDLNTGVLPYDGASVCISATVQQMPCLKVNAGASLCVCSVFVYVCVCL